MKKYLRLLNYENACKVVSFVNENDKYDYASIVVGGVSIKTSEVNWGRIEAFIQSLNVRYEVVHVPPHEINEQIINDIKANKYSTTTGEWLSQPCTEGVEVFVGKKVICRIPFKDKTIEDYSNELLIIDAGNTIQESGLLPSNLMNQRDVLMKSALRAIRDLERSNSDKSIALDSLRSALNYCTEYV